MESLPRRTKHFPREGERGGYGHGGEVFVSRLFTHGQPPRSPAAYSRHISRTETKELASYWSAGRLGKGFGQEVFPCLHGKTFCVLQARHDRSQPHTSVRHRRQDPFSPLRWSSTVPKSTLFVLPKRNWFRPRLRKSLSSGPAQGLNCCCSGGEQL